MLFTEWSELRMNMAWQKLYAYRSTLDLFYARLVPISRMAAPNGANLFFCRLCPFFLKPLRQCLGPSQWDRRLEGWPNTAACLAGWRRVTRQVWFCTWWMDRTACLFHTVPYSPDRSYPAASWWNFQLLFYSKCAQHPSWIWSTSRKEAMAWYSSRPMPYLWDLPVISLLLTNTVSSVRACPIIWWVRFRGTQ